MYYLKFKDEFAKFTELEENFLAPLADVEVQPVAVTRGSKMNKNIIGDGFSKNDIGACRLQRRGSFLIILLPLHLQRCPLQFDKLNPAIQ